MKLSELKEALEICELNLADEDCEFQVAFATDLMSDALHLIQQDSEHTLLITGLCNAQSVRTADMLDLKTILYVRGKQLQDEDLQLAQSLNLNILSTSLTMYEVCGQLYELGIKAVS